MHNGCCTSQEDIRTKKTKKIKKKIEKMLKTQGQPRKSGSTFQLVRIGQQELGWKNKCQPGRIKEQETQDLKELDKQRCQNIWTKSETEQSSPTT